MKTNHYIAVFVCRQTLAGPEFMQLLRAPGKFMADTWQLVNGKIEPGETAWQAALRELFEETGLEPTEFYQVDRVNTFYLAADDSLNHVPMFCAIIPAGRKRD